MADADRSFAVECPDCGIAEAADEFEAVALFDRKHREHTGHRVEWVRAEFDYDVTPRGDWRVECDVCEDAWTFETEDDARAFVREHARYTTHEIDDDPTVEADSLAIDDGDGDADADGADLVLTIVEEMERNRFPQGVPKEPLHAVLVEEGADLAAVRAALYRLREDGAIRESTPGYLETT